MKERTSIADTGNQMTSDQGNPGDIVQKLISTTVDQKAIQRYVALDLEKILLLAGRIHAQRLEACSHQYSVDVAIDLLQEADEQVARRRGKLLRNMNAATLGMLANRLGCNSHANKSNDDPSRADVNDPVKGPVIGLLREIDRFYQQLEPRVREFIDNAAASSDKRGGKVPFPKLPVALIPALHFAARAPTVSSKILKQAFIDYLETLGNTPDGEISTLVCSVRSCLITPAKVRRPGKRRNEPAPSPTHDPKITSKHLWEDSKPVTELATLAWLADGFCLFWQEQLANYLNPAVETSPSGKSVPESQPQPELTNIDGTADEQWLSITAGFVNSHKDGIVPTAVDEQTDHLRKFAKKAARAVRESGHAPANPKKQIRKFLGILMNHPYEQVTDELQEQLMAAKIHGLSEATIRNCWKLLETAGLLAVKPGGPQETPVPDMPDGTSPA